jgi:hypothetical protein
MNNVTLAAPKNFAAELVRRGLPIEYAQHVAAELDDHRHDLLGELRASGLDECTAAAEAARRLGDNRQLVKRTVREFRQRHWCGRWPIVAFFLGPIPAVIAAWIATGLAVLCVLWPLAWLGFVGDFEPDGIVTTGEWIVDRLVQAWFLLAVPALVMFGFARLARRAALGWPWILATASVLALSVGLVKSGFPNPALLQRRADGGPLRADSRLLTLGLPLLAPNSATPRAIVESLTRWYLRDFEQSAQFLLPLAVAGGMVARARYLASQRERALRNAC